MQNGLNEYISRLVALRTLFESANEEITRSEFETFSGRLFEGHLGVLRVAWMPRVNRKERVEYEAAAIADGVSGYRIKSLAADGSITTSPERDEYFPVLFSTEPKTSMIYGLDYRTDPDRRATLERARDNDTITALRGRLYEIKDGVRPNAVLVCVPVLDKGTSRTTVADRRRNHAGFVVGIFDLPLLLQSIRTTTGQVRPSASMFTRPICQAGSTISVGARFSSTRRRRQSRRAFAQGPHWSATLRIGDTSWPVLAIPATGGHFAARHDRANAVLAAGFSVTIFLAVYLAVASRNSLKLSLANRRVLELAQTDILTGLPNRAFFLEQLAADQLARDASAAARSRS